MWNWIRLFLLICFLPTLVISQPNCAKLNPGSSPENCSNCNGYDVVRCTFCLPLSGCPGYCDWSCPNNTTVTDCNKVPIFQDKCAKSKTCEECINIRDGDVACGWCSVGCFIGLLSTGKACPMQGCYDWSKTCSNPNIGRYFGFPVNFIAYWICFRRTKQIPPPSRECAHKVWVSSLIMTTYYWKGDYLGYVGSEKELELLCDGCIPDFFGDIDRVKRVANTIFHKSGPEEPIHILVVSDINGIGKSTLMRQLAIQGKAHYFNFCIKTPFKSLCREVTFRCYPCETMQLLSQQRCIMRAAFIKAFASMQKGLEFVDQVLQQ